jgi:surface antigen
MLVSLIYRGWRRAERATSWRVPAALFIALHAAGCSLTLPFMERESAREPELTTGSIGPRPVIARLASAPSTFAGGLDAEDNRRAIAALAIALDPQGNGAPVRWDNAETGARGTITPAGDPFLIGHDICRRFSALTTLAGTATPEPRTGTACRKEAGVWDLRGG